MRLLLAFACVLLFSLPAQATPARRESVEAMFTAIGVQTTWDARLPALQRSFAQRLPASPATPGQKRRIDWARARIFKLLGDEMSWQGMGADITQLYADLYTQEEIDGLLAFYGSPMGRALMAKAPALFANLAASGDDWRHDGTFTPDEIAAFDAFHRSPATRSMIDKQATMIERAQQINQVHMDRIRPQIVQMLREAQAPDRSAPFADAAASARP